MMNLISKESEFLRLRRVRLGIDDFQTIQVIGKGAYGEVRYLEFIQVPYFDKAGAEEGYRTCVCAQVLEEKRNDHQGSNGACKSRT
jgi:hypothetical protein